MVKLYYTPTSCGASSFICAFIAGLNFDCEIVDLSTHKTESGIDFYTINPKGNVPTLILDDGTILNENISCLEYILDLLSGCLIGNIPDEKFQIWTGTGCHSKGTQVLMYDGNLRNVEDIQIGEYVMGDDSRRRLVTEIFRGRAKMYRINQIDFFSNYVVNGRHILSLRIINSKYAINFKGYNVYQVEGYYYIDITWDLSEIHLTGCIVDIKWTNDHNRNAGSEECALLARVSVSERMSVRFWRE